MKTSEMINELEKEIDDLTEIDSLESVKNHLIKSKILTEESVNALTKEQIEGFLDGIGKDQLTIQQKELEHKQYLNDMRSRVLSIEDNVKIFNKEPGYIVLSGNVIPQTSTKATRNYFRYDLGVSADMLSLKTNKPVKVKFLYIGIMTQRECEGINHYCNYIETNIYPENNGTFMSEVLDHIMSTNEQTKLILTQYGEPVFAPDLQKLPSGICSSFFLSFFSRMQRRDVSVFLDTQTQTN